MATPATEPVEKVYEKRVNIAVVIVSLAVFFPIMFFLFDRQPPFTGHVGFMVPDRVHAGEDVAVNWTLVTHRICPGMVQREIVDSKGVIWNYDAQPAIRRDQMTSDGSKLNRTFKISRSAAPGPAKYRARMCYTCNRVQGWFRWPICERTPDVAFEILPPLPQ